MPAPDDLSNGLLVRVHETSEPSAQRAFFTDAATVARSATNAVRAFARDAESRSRSIAEGCVVT